MPGSAGNGASSVSVCPSATPAISPELSGQSILQLSSSVVFMRFNPVIISITFVRTEAL